MLPVIVTKFGTASMTRHSARVAYFSGDKAAASERLRQSSEQLAAAGFADDSARDRYGLGLLITAAKARS